VRAGDDSRHNQTLRGAAHDLYGKHQKFRYQVEHHPFILAFSIPTVAPFRAQLPSFIPLYLLLLLPLFSIIALVLAIYPRFVITPGFPFFIKRSVVPDDFKAPPENDEELLALFRIRCAALAKILYWKILLFRIAMASCLLYLAVLFLLAIGGVFYPLPTESHS
jgi:hypothetical protein